MIQGGHQSYRDLGNLREPRKLVPSIGSKVTSQSLSCMHVYFIYARVIIDTNTSIYMCTTLLRVIALRL